MSPPAAIAICALARGFSVAHAAPVRWPLQTSDFLELSGGKRQLFRCASQVSLRQAPFLLVDIYLPVRAPDSKNPPLFQLYLTASASMQDVWRALTDTDLVAQWMGGARVESKWEPDADITFTGTLHRYTHRDRGTVLAVEPRKLLKYSHGARLSRLPDLPQNRTVVTLSLDWTGEKTSLTVRHECFYSDAEYKHANYFWGFALNDIKHLLER